MTGRLIISDEIVAALQRSGVIDLPSERLRRVVIDLQAGDVPRIYTEQFGDSRLSDALLAAGLGTPPRMLPVEAWRPPA